jgi:hypothetical protein
MSIAQGAPGAPACVYMLCEYHCRLSSPVVEMTT